MLIDDGLLKSAQVSQQALARIQPLGAEHLVVRINGEWASRQVPPGVMATDLASALRDRGEVIRQVIEADGLTPSEQKLTSLNLAFHHDAVFIEIPAGFQSEEPIRLVRLLSALPGISLFPLTMIVIGAGSTATIIQEDLSASSGPSGPAHVINGRVELVLEPHANVRYCRVQQWDAASHEFALQRATLHEAAELSMVNIHVGGRISKTHVIAKLVGRQATSRVFGFLFGHGDQHLDYHSLQDHQAPQTMSDLLYKAALKDQSRMIYTGLIRIAKAAKQTDAFQANHNLLLSQGAKAETIPMLEILADDVRCKHGATVGPVDEEQLFYLMTRGIPRTLAERLLVMGFVEPVLEQVPFEPLRDRLREELEGSLQAA